MLAHFLAVRVHELEIPAVDRPGLPPVLLGLVHRGQGDVRRFKRRVGRDRPLEVRDRPVRLIQFDSDAPQVVVPDRRVFCLLDPPFELTRRFLQTSQIDQQDALGEVRFAALGVLSDGAIVERQRSFGLSGARIDPGQQDQDGLLPHVRHGHPIGEPDRIVHVSP